MLGFQKEECLFPIHDDRNWATEYNPVSHRDIGSYMCNSTTREYHVSYFSHPCEILGLEDVLFRTIKVVHVASSPKCMYIIKVQVLFYRAIRHGIHFCFYHVPW